MPRTLTAGEGEPSDRPFNLETVEPPVYFGATTALPLLKMKKFAKEHPLTLVLIVAGLVRLVSVLWSKGFIHSDDHFDTVAVAWDWLQGGLWGDNGFLRWKNKPSETIGRFPLYTLFLYGEMKLAQWLGMISLDSMMYLVRFSHALISLLPVWAFYRVTIIVTKSWRWAVAAGLLAGLHFGFSFLGVRNLIEVVGGSLWIAAICFIYRYGEGRATRYLYLAAVLTGLAWMIRFQIAFAVVPVPLLLWWQHKRILPAVHYALGVVAMLVLSGLTDSYLLGRFAGSTLTNLGMNTGLDALYTTIPALYIALLVLLLIPPWSVVGLWMVGRLSFIRTHKVLVVSSLFFVVAHASHPNQQERFIFPIIPAFLLMTVLAAWQYSKDKDVDLPGRSWFRWVGGISVALNTVLLIFLTPAYGHRGMVEPMIWFQRNHPTARVLYLQPGVKRWAPSEYGGTKFTAFYAKSWDDPDWLTASKENDYDFVLIYPKRAAQLPDYLDSVRTRIGEVVPVREFEPSAYDQLLHRMNPAHNDNFAAYLFRPSGQ